MTEKTRHQITRFLDKVAEKFPYEETPTLYTDLHIHVSQESGDIMAFNDDNEEITRCIVEDWMQNKSTPEHFYKEVTHSIREILSGREHKLGLSMPYSYVLEDESGEHIDELYIVDDSETIILGEPFMQDLEKDLDDFINKLLDEK